MKRLISIWLCFVLVASSAFVLVGGEDEVVEGKVVVQNGVTYTTHTPIRIDSNADFGIGINGVSAGNGSAGNPWIIEGWAIDGTGFGYCIYIGNTTNYFIIKNLYVHNADGGTNYPYCVNRGITLLNVVNGELKNIIASSNRAGGIFVYSSNNNIVENNTALANQGIIYSAVEFYQSDNNIIRNNSVFSNTRNGILISSSNNNIIINNNVTDNNNGIVLYLSSDCLVANNTVFSNSEDGILIISSIKCVLRNNTMKDSGIHMVGDLLSHWNTHSIDTSNTVNSRPIYYWKNQTNGTLPPDAGGIILANCTNVVVEGQNMTGGFITLGYSYKNNVSNNSLSNSNIALYISHSSNNNVKNNNISYSVYGIYPYTSNQNNISTNRVSNCSNLGMWLYHSDENEIVSNYILANDNGVEVYGSFDNVIYHNSFIANTNQAYDDNAPSNSWDNGYPSGGNYWDNYTDSDIMTGPSQNIPGNDGIWDTPYDFLSGAQDMYPLVYDSNPRIELISPPDNSTIIPGTMISLSVWDMDDDISIVNYSLNGGVNQTLNIPYMINTNGWPEGPSAIVVNAVDRKNNSASESFLFILDGINPEIVLNAPANNSVISSGTIVNFTVSDSNLVSVYYSSDGGINSLFPAPYDYNTTSWAYGNHTLQITAYDVVDHVSIKWFNFFVNTPIINPIRINSNADFTSENGVTGGSGTQIDPWVIEGWIINGTGYGYCIYVGNTTDYFTIKDCSLYNVTGTIIPPYYWNTALSLNNVQNATVVNNTISGQLKDIALINPMNISTMASTSLYGIKLEDSNNIQILNNTVSVL